MLAERRVYCFNILRRRHMTKGRSTPLLLCLVLLALVPGVMNGQKGQEKGDIGDRIAVLYPDDPELSARILAKYIDLKHLLPHYTLVAERQEFEAARQKLESAQEAALYAKRDLDESLRGRPVITATVMEPEEVGPPLMRDELDISDEPDVPDKSDKSDKSDKPDAPAPETAKQPVVHPDRLPPRQITIHPYRLEEAAPEIAKHFTKEELIKVWPK
jgi:hypothetical protein